MEKYLKIKCTDGGLFIVPTLVIAENRANYYSKIDGYEIESNEWQNEIEYAMNDEYELKDWIQENMNWTDLEPFAKEFEEENSELDYQNDFSDIEIELYDEN